VNTELIKIISHGFISKRRVVKKTNGKILIVFGGVIGDSIIFFDVLPELIAFFRKQGKEVVLVCNTVIESYMRSIRPDIEINTIGYEMDRLIEDYAYFRDFIAGLNSTEYESVITPMSSKKADLIALNVNAPKKIIVMEPIKRKTSVALWLKKITYTDTIAVDMYSMAYVRYKKLMGYLGDTRFQSKISYYSEQRSIYDFNNHSPYCVICPTSREGEKCWEIGKLCLILDYIAEATDLNIYISTGNEGIGLFERISSLVKSPNRLVDYIDNTSFSDWVECIRNARFCLGNDSASTHIAAHTQTLYIAVTSGFDYGVALPYVLDVAPKESNLPICIFNKKPCFGCVEVYGKRCGNNKECKKNVREYGRFLCIEDISVEDVKSVLTRVLTRKGYNN